MRSVEEKIALARQAESLLCKLGTLSAAGKHLGVTGERVRQIMVDGHRNGWVKYRPFGKRGVCAAVARLPEAIRRAKSYNELWSMCGVSAVAGKGLLSSIGVDTAQFDATIKANRTAFHINRLRMVAEQLGVGNTLNTAPIQATKEGKTAYNCAIRYAGGIVAVRKALGITAEVKRGRRPA